MQKNNYSVCSKNDKKDPVLELCKRQFNMIVPNVICLKAMYDKALSEHSIEVCSGLAQLFTLTGQTYMDWILSSVQYFYSNPIKSNPLFYIIFSV